MTIIYADLTFLVNMLVNGIILWCTMHLSGLPVRWPALVAAAVLGSVYGVFAVIPGQTFLSSLVVKCCVSFLMVRIAFGRDPWLLRRYVLFLLASGVLSGLCVAIQAIPGMETRHEAVLLAAVIFCVVSLGVIFRRSATPSENAALLSATIFHRGRSVSVLLLRDTGNTLRDPNTGRILCVVWDWVLRPLEITQTQEIGYRSLGQASGTLPYFYCDRLTVSGQEMEHYPIGIAEQPLSAGGRYAGLWNGGEENYHGTMDP